MLGWGGDLVDNVYRQLGRLKFCVGTTRSGVMGLAAKVLPLAAAFFFGFPAAGLVAAVD